MSNDTIYQVAATGACGGLSGVMFFISERKNSKIKPKDVIPFALLYIFFIGFAGFSEFLFAKYSLSPQTVFILDQFYFLILGSFFTYFFYKKYSVNLKNLFFSELLVLLATAAFGIVIFIIVFNVKNNFSFGLFFSSSIISFFIPFLYRETFFYYLKIPKPIYKIWKYPADFYEPDIDNINLDKLILVEIELRKNIKDTTESNLKVKALRDMILSDWFYSIIQDYNYRQPESPIETKDANGETYEWQFFVKPSWYRDRRYLDPEMTISENKIRENLVIIADRVVSE